MINKLRVYLDTGTLVSGIAFIENREWSQTAMMPVKDAFRDVMDPHLMRR